jgi:alkylhydroperoxidase family enzyme
VGSHEAYLQVQGQDVNDVDALRRGDLDAAAVSPAERELLKFVELLTRDASGCRPTDIERLREVGWTDPQIAEGVYITSLFAFFNRVADAFGLEDPPADLLKQLQSAGE